MPPFQGYKSWRLCSQGVALGYRMTPRWGFVALQRTRQARSLSDIFSTAFSIHYLSLLDSLQQTNGHRHTVHAYFQIGFDVALGVRRIERQPHRDQARARNLYAHDQAVLR